mmetsp:Transcript_18428/g.43173  ORF Transcript_18428/g.43173 Transcript_18428/m.43173 type:complete len:103 (+) Transcript_18428:612-920(+)
MLTYKDRNSSPYAPFVWANLALQSSWGGCRAGMFFMLRVSTSGSARRDLATELAAPSDVNRSLTLLQCSQFERQRHLLLTLVGMPLLMRWDLDYKSQLHCLP